MSFCCDDFSENHVEQTFFETDDQSSDGGLLSDPSDYSEYQVTQHQLSNGKSVEVVSNLTSTLPITKPEIELMQMYFGDIIQALFQEVA